MMVSDGARAGEPQIFVHTALRLHLIVSYKNLNVKQADPSFFNASRNSGELVVFAIQRLSS
jgi:hypothetical protein